MRAEDLVRRIVTIGASAQASVPAIYAWGVTVAPPAWARGASLAAKGAAILALAMLGVGAASERRWGVGARLVGFWGFVTASAVVWSVAPAGLNPLRFDTQAGLAGMLGWALFAFASAAPPLGATRDEEHASDGPLLSTRHRLARGDAVYLACGALATAVLCTVGWRIANVERALLARSVSLAAGLAIMGAATQIALARHAQRAPRTPSRRVRRALLSLVALGLLALAGLLLLVLD